MTRHNFVTSDWFESMHTGHVEGLIQHSVLPGTSGCHHGTSQQRIREKLGLDFPEPSAGAGAVGEHRNITISINHVRSCYNQTVIPQSRLCVPLHPGSLFFPVGKRNGTKKFRYVLENLRQLRK